MDISEVVRFWKLFLPLSAIWMIFRTARRIRFRWLRVSIRAVASSVLVCGLLFVCLLFMFELGCSKHPPSIYSPDGSRLAVLSYILQGALGDDYATVSVRSRWVPWAQPVYHGVGAWDFKQNRPADPEVRWVDRSHLLIRSLFLRREYTACLDRIGDIHVICEALPESPPSGK
jgi:hypothetical protein